MPRYRHRLEEALPVAALLAVRRSWEERGTPVHTAFGGSAAQGLLAEEWIAAGDDHYFYATFVHSGKHPQRGVVRW